MGAYRTVIVDRHGGQGDSLREHFVWSSLRWVLSHGIVFLIVAFLAYGYAIRDRLFPAAQPESPREQVSVIDPSAEGRVGIDKGSRSIPEAASSSRPTISKQAIALTESIQAASPSKSTPAEPEQAPVDDTQEGLDAVSDDGFTNRTRDAEASGAGLERLSHDSLMADPPANVLDGPSSTTADHASGPATEPTPVTPAASLWTNLEGPAGNPVEGRAAQVFAGSAQTWRLLEQARRAFWSGELVLAESRYREVLASVGSVPEVYGELGNLYFHQGRHDWAAEAYYEAGMGFISHGQSRQAWAVVGLLHRMNPVRAQRLEQALRGTVARP